MQRSCTDVDCSYEQQNPNFLVGKIRSRYMATAVCNDVLLCLWGGSLDAMITATAAGDGTFLQALVRSRAKIGSAPLLDSTTSRTTRVLWCLCQADLEACDDGGDTALTRAAHNGTVAVVQELLRLGADVNAQDHYGCNAVTAAALRENATVVRILLEAGADVNVAENNGFTVMSEACRWMDSNYLKMILEWGADPTVMFGQRSMERIISGRTDIEPEEQEAMLMLLTAPRVASSEDRS